MKTLSFETPVVEIGPNDPVATKRAGGTPDGMQPGYVLYPKEGPALWFHEALESRPGRLSNSPWPNARSRNWTL